MLCVVNQKGTCRRRTDASNDKCIHLDFWIMEVVFAVDTLVRLSMAAINESNKDGLDN
jgi:hypothetical protein